MVDRAPLEAVEDVKKAIFELSNAAGKLGRDFKAWEDIAFTPEGPPDFIVIREGLRALNYTTTMMLEDVLQWCAANTPPPGASCPPSRRALGGGGRASAAVADAARADGHGDVQRRGCWSTRGRVGPSRPCTWVPSPNQQGPIVGSDNVAATSAGATRRRRHAGRGRERA